ncbi:hypothetical protein ACLKA7_001305 [Drosophila subpalustris]
MDEDGSNLSVEWLSAGISQKTAISGGIRTKRKKVAGRTRKIFRTDFQEESSNWSPRPWQPVQKNPLEPMEMSGVSFKLTEKEPGPTPVCKDVEWFQGTVKGIPCDDSRSVELYKTADTKVGEIYPRAKLAANDWNEVPTTGVDVDPVHP